LLELEIKNFSSYARVFYQTQDHLEILNIVKSGELFTSSPEANCLNWFSGRDLQVFQVSPERKSVFPMESLFHQDSLDFLIRNKLALDSTFLNQRIKACIWLEQVVKLNREDQPKILNKPSGQLSPVAIEFHQLLKE